MSDRIRIRRALLSVYDKTGIVELARALAASGAELISSGGTAASLREAGLDVTDVSDVTGFPEMLSGRVKTLHPKIHAGLLANRADPEHMATLDEHGIGAIDLVVVNLYPFDSKVDPATAEAQAIELIDVGGPTMVRAAAKNMASVAVVVDPADYQAVVEAIGGDGLDAAARRALAGKAFRRLSAYDAAIAGYLERGEEMPAVMSVTAERLSVLRYGENPHQRAAVYKLPGAPRGIASGAQLQGKELSYTNYLDLDAAFRLATSFAEPAACIVKHTTPCGAAVASDPGEAYRLAFECDPRSAFGGIVGLNRPCDAQVAGQMIDVFLECVVAPDFTDEAREVLAAKKNLRLIQVPEAAWIVDPAELRSISGGLLVQSPDRTHDPRDEMKVVTKRAPSDAEWEDLLFAWAVCAMVKSNAIVLARSRQAVGVGAGQMSRIEAMELAIGRAGDRAKGSVAASDAFFPMPDSVEAAAAAGVSAIIHPGGSLKDDDSIAAADEADIAMVLTGFRHFRH